MRAFSYLVPKKYDGAALQDYLKYAQGYSRRLIIDLKKGGILVNGAHRRMVDPVREGDRIDIVFEEPACDLVPTPLPAVPVVYEDEDMVLFNKPAGMSVHPSADGFSHSLGNYFAYRYHNALTFRPVSRLDKNTSGLCLSAKNTLSASFLVGHTEKTYLAVAEGSVPDDEGVIDLPIARVEGSLILREISPAGQRAVTRYRVLKRLDGLTLLKIRLETGRTHQIRVHFSALGHPLAGDTLYGGSDARIGRHALHCFRISFPHPFTKEPLSFTAPLPEDMRRLIKK